MFGICSPEIFLAAKRLEQAPPPGPDPDGDAVQAYEAALERLAYAIRTWEEKGSPLMTYGSQGQEVVHPLWKVVNEAEGMADKLRDRLRKKQRGPAAAGVMGRAIGASPATKLRVAR
jgi:hypothetical protein